jgi:hypothetical protein
MTLPTLGPVDKSFTITDPINGYVYRDNPTFTPNLDQVQVIVRYPVLDLRGNISVNANGSDVISTSAVEDLNDNFWAQIYLLLHEMAQKRDGYKSTESSLTTPLNVVYRDSLILAIKINIRVLWAMYHALFVNMGMRSMQQAFGGTRSRMQRILEASNTLIYPQEFDPIIDYWSEIYSPYPGGPIVVNLFNLNQWVGYNAGTLRGSSNPTNWVAVPDWDASTNATVASLCHDLENALNVLLRYQTNDSDTADDLRYIQSLYSMMGFPTPQTGVKGLGVNPAKFQEQFQRYGYLFYDTKGAGTDTYVYWPDAMGSVDTLLDVEMGGFPFDTLDMIGAKGIYAWDADDDATECYTPVANDLLAYGMVGLTQWVASGLGNVQSPIIDIYTEEDGWQSLSINVDYTAAAGLQEHLWKLPWLTVHPQGWRVIMSEEAEESMRTGFSVVGGTKVQIPFDHFGQAFRKWVYQTYKIPYVT